MAEQSPSQQDRLRLVSIILANVGTVICFRSASPSDEDLLLPLFRPYLDLGDIINLPTYNFYMRLAALESHEPFSGTTMLLADKGSNKTAEPVIKSSRALYANKYVAKELDAPNDKARNKIQMKRSIKRQA